MAFFNKLKKKKKDLTVRIDQLLKFSSNKSVGELNLGRETERETIPVYSELPTLARVRWDERGDLEGASGSWGGFAAQGHRQTSETCLRAQFDPRVGALAVVSPAKTERLS